MNKPTLPGSAYSADKAREILDAHEQAREKGQPALGARDLETAQVYALLGIAEHLSRIDAQLTDIDKSLEHL